MKQEKPNFNKIFDCGECGQKVMSDTKHTFEDCKKYKRRKRNKI